MTNPVAFEVRFRMTMIDPAFPHRNQSLSSPAMKFITSLTLPLAAFLLAACKTTPVAPETDRFAQADRNGDGELTETEFNNASVSEIFSSRDANGDGNMTRAEWNTDMGAEETKQFNLRDTNKDGMVSLSEGCAHALKAKRFTGEWESADTNKNGTISRAEATAFYGSKEGPVR